MAIELREDCFYLAVWFVSFPDEAKMDAMGMIWREPDGTVRGRYRHRYYKSDDAWDDQDEKHWFNVKLNGGPELEEKLRELRWGWEYAAQQFHGDVDWNENVGNGAAVMALLETKPWAQMREEFTV